MVLAEWRYVRTRDELYLELARRWAKGTAILFAVGAVSGTVLSFELGLLWPRFMEYGGPIIGMPFSMEGFAFFLEAIFLGVSVYGWERVPGHAHLAAGVAVALSGLASGIFVVSVNAWMNTPAGFSMQNGRVTSIDFRRAFFSPAFFGQALHMVLAAYASVALVVLAIHAARLLKDPKSGLHRRAAWLSLVVAVVAIPLQVASGDFVAKQVAAYQPVKLAAAEGLFESQRGAPLSVGGIPDEEARTLRGALHIPYALSFLATGDPNGLVLGLDQVARSEWPPLAIVHLSFQAMVACGSAMLAFAGWACVLFAMRRDPLASRPFLRASVACG